MAIFFIKYPSLIEYCQKGNFLREEDGMICLLESEKKEIYTKVFQDYFRDNFNIQTYCYHFYNGFDMEIGFANDEYFLVKNCPDTKLSLCIWNNGEIIGHSLYLERERGVHGNTKAVKHLDEFNWKKNADGDFERFGNAKLIKLGNNYEENFLNAKEAIIKLLKNGLGIKSNKI